MACSNKLRHELIKLLARTEDSFDFTIETDRLSNVSRDERALSAETDCGHHPWKIAGNKKTNQPISHRRIKVEAKQIMSRLRDYNNRSWNVFPQKKNNFQIFVLKKKTSSAI